MLSPKNGQVLFDGISLYEKSTDQRAEFRKNNIGFVFQTFNLIPFLTAKQNVQMPLLLNRHPAANQEDRASQLLSRLGLADRLEHKPSELSVGQQQRVALARMLSNDPPIIIADEPTGSLDPDTSKQILDFLNELNQEGRTVIMVTHNPDAAERATRCLHLVDGRINEYNGLQE
ncbi:MAG: ABC transporter ATP-binding protein [Candidatus Magnetoglobus multicellularis str. Araruama]|uniref:ABC transporter ATP-binding protein n=1 Tax=Candidatus Magnetoglobus multicellularis str. Araruama TaxID=890399 RepID=A0A1V1NZ56_9BACT|nr:MAG: ABC transporter ATP-binding protein [Candidatus Magnetoglobus multicellularis str. Araruama]